MGGGTEVVFGGDAPVAVAGGVAEGSSLSIPARIGPSMVAAASRRGGNWKGWPLGRENGGKKFLLGVAEVEYI